MDKRIYDMALGWMGILLFAACTSTSSAGSHEPPIDTKAPIVFGSKVTRAAVDADKQNMQSFSVWGGYGNSHNNLFDAETVTPQGQYTGTRYWVSGQTHNFYALHPAGLTEGTTGNKVECTNGGVITVTDFDTSANKGAAAIDLMTASATGISYTAGTTPSPVALTFSHELSKVKVSVEPQGEVKISEACLYGISSKGTMTRNFSAGNDVTTVWTLETALTAENTPFKASPSSEVISSAYTLFDNLLLIPQSLAAAKVQLTYQFRGEEQPRTSDLVLSTDKVETWEKGKSYHYKLSISPLTTSITITVTVEDWIQKDVSVEW